MDIRAPEQQYNPYRIFSREQWARLRDDAPMTLGADEIARLRSMHDRLDLSEVEDIYLPLSRLLSIYVDAMQRLFVAQRRFLGIEDRKMPYIIGVAGSVAVGKSTTSRVLLMDALLDSWRARRTPPRAGSAWTIAPRGRARPRRGAALQERIADRHPA